LERIDSAGASEFDAFMDRMKAREMARFVLILALVLIASAASAQQQQRQQGHDACARDVSRLCRAQMNEGDQIVLACLKQNRSRLGRACAKVLADHGQ
jgi:hypothetical protein